MPCSTSTTSRRPTAKLRKWPATRTPRSARPSRRPTALRPRPDNALTHLQITCTSCDPLLRYSLALSSFPARFAVAPRLARLLARSHRCLANSRWPLHPTRHRTEKCGCSKSSCRLFRWGGKLKVRPRRWFGASLAGPAPGFLQPLRAVWQALVARRSLSCST